MTALEILLAVLVGLWVFVPALLPNPAAVIFGGGKPVDFGRTWKGKRILGDGKTWRGLFGGAFAGVAIGLMQIGIAYLFDSPDLWGFGPLWSSIGILFTLSFGAVLGDMGGSVIKRRMGKERGAEMPILDQYDFLIGAFLLTALFYPNWIYSVYIEGWNILALIFLLLITYMLHRVVNIIGYKAGVKNEPW
ncbi:MAG: CDP-2,3-bis-(O-geranylgeranyl)-sn-glycerol synthase [Candidatus Methanomethylophilaceae archaeon]|nr:CDP-2,3-bis-(O-geranylgeranyl)-sn-glycerol synthase [Candidatus Methanomethylophilaceae archaeon]